MDPSRELSLRLELVRATDKDFESQRVQALSFSGKAARFECGTNCGTSWQRRLRQKFTSRYRRSVANNVPVGTYCRGMFGLR